MLHSSPPRTPQTVLKLLDRLERAEEIVEKLTTLADGVPATDGMTVWVRRNPDEESEIEPDVLAIGPINLDLYGLDRCYSTREAALAARQGAKDGE